MRGKEEGKGANVPGRKMLTQKERVVEKMRSLKEITKLNFIVVSKRFLFVCCLFCIYSLLRENRKFLPSTGRLTAQRRVRKLPGRKSILTIICGGSTQFKQPLN